MSRQRAQNVDLGSDVARLNLLTNGGFEIWQRGAGGFTTSGGYASDRWSLSIAPGSSMSIDRVAGETSGTYAAQITYTHAAISQFFQKFMLSSEWAWLKGKQITFSARVFSNVANAIRVTTAGSTGTPSSYHPGGGIWTTLSSTATVGTGTELHVQFELNASGTFWVDNAMLVVGNVSADYAPLHPADDLARCERYYEVPGVDGTGSIILMMYAPAVATSMRLPLRWRQKKAATPTITKVGTWTVNQAGQPTIQAPSVDGCYLNSMTNGVAGDVFVYNVGGSGYLTVEANP